ncbi:MAG TPA: hypothetical protein VF185_01090 [Patescibacteria group bacterium]
MGPKSYFRGQQYLFNLMALYKRRPDLKAFLELLLSIVTIGLFSIFAIKPTALTISNLLTEINEKQKTIEQMDAKILNLQQAQSILASQQANIALLSDAVPTSPSLGQYIRQIEGVIKKDNVVTQNIGSEQITLAGTSPVLAGPPDQRKTLPQGSSGVGVSISVAGDYNTISTFLADIELLRRPLVFDSLNFTATEIDNVKNLYLTIEGRAPYQEAQTAQTK